MAGTHASGLTWSDQHICTDLLIDHRGFRMGCTQASQLASVPAFHGNHGILRSDFHGAEGAGIQRQVPSPSITDEGLHRNRRASWCRKGAGSSG